MKNIVEYPKTKNRYEIIEENSMMKNPETREWTSSVIYKEYKKFDEYLNSYIDIPEQDKRIFVRDKKDFLEKFIEVQKRKATFYYGMSGTFKATLIKEELKKSSEDTLPMWSMIKPWKRLEDGILHNKLLKNHLNFAALHLTFLEGYNIYPFIQKDILIERGITDMAFYYNNNINEENLKLTDEEVKKLVNQELNLCKEREIKKILLIQNDKNFVRDVVLKEDTRKREFSSLKDYFEKQDYYIFFSNCYNNFDQVIEINNAKDFLESKNIKFEV